MPKFIRCAECGVKLEITRRATPNLTEKIIDVVPPHSCEEFKSLKDLGIEPEPLMLGTNKKFDQNLIELNKQTKAPEPLDRRPVDQVRKDSIAPKTLLDAFANKTLSSEGE